MSEHDTEELWSAFFAGFMASGEGWNGEMSRFWEESDTEEKEMEILRQEFEEWLEERDSE